MAEYCIKSEIELENQLALPKFSSLNHRLYKAILPQLKRAFDQFIEQPLSKLTNRFLTQKHWNIFPVLSKQLLILCISGKPSQRKV